MMAKKHIIYSVAIAGLLMTAVTNSAIADGAALYKEKMCNTCHGPDGNKGLLPTYPKIAGQNAPYLIQQIKDIRDGKRTNGMTAAMKPLVANLSDADIQAISDWLATQ